MEIIYTFTSIFLVSFVSLVGVFFLSLKEMRLQTIMHLLVGLAAGALLGDAFIHLIPEVFEEGLSGVIFSVAILAGILVFFMLEKYLHWQHHEHNAEHTHLPAHSGCEVKKQINPLGTLVLFGDGLHNFVDGAIIAASFMVSPALGITTTIAVFLHEIPQEIADFALLLHAGFSRAKALLWNFVSALTALLGAGAFFIIGGTFSGIEPVAAAFTAGGFIYIAAADLIPELHETKHPGRSALQLLAMLVGIGLMFLLLLLE
jgi:zinc and cadmium transporter